MSTMVRTHVLLPRELVEELDRQVGPRKRSETIATLVEEFLRRNERDGLEDFAGTMPADDYPEWATPEAAAAWVARQRTAGRTIGWGDGEE